MATSIIPGQQSPSNQQNIVGRQEKGTGFVNLNRVLGANQGAGQQIGQTIGNALTQQGQTVLDTTNKSKQDFDTKSQAAINPTYNVLQAAGQLKQQTGESDDDYSKRIAQNSAQGGTDYAQIGKNVKDAEYSGPTELADADKLRNQAGTVNNLNQLAGTSSGQNQLLRNFVAGGNNYSTGQAALDQYLLGSEGQGALQKGLNNIAGINSKVNSAIGGTQTQANAYKKDIDTQKTNTLTDVNNSFGKLLQQGQAAGDAYNSGASSLQNLLTQAGTNGFGSLSQTQKDQLASLYPQLQNYGIDMGAKIDTRDQGLTNQFYGNLVSQPQMNQGGSRFNANQQATVNALNSFLGNDASTLPVTNNDPAFNVNMDTARAGIGQKDLADNAALSAKYDAFSQLQPLLSQDQGNWDDATKNNYSQLVNQIGAPGLSNYNNIANYLFNQNNTLTNDIKSHTTSVGDYLRQVLGMQPGGVIK